MLTPASRHIGILDFREKSKKQFGAREISWFVEACNQFMRKELRSLYPEDPVWTVEHYSSITNIDLVEVWPMGLFDDDGLPDALGHHYTQWGLIGAAIDCLDRSIDDILSTILHELEMCFNPYLVNWANLPDRRRTPREAGDPVQWEPYPINVSQRFGGVTQSRSFNVQNMVGARYWGELPAANLVPFDLRGSVTSAHQWPLKGYRVIKDRSTIYNEYGAATNTRMGARKFSPLSRTWCLMKLTPTLTQTRGGWSVSTSSSSSPPSIEIANTRLVKSMPTQLAALHAFRKALVSSPT